jgi:hypothetical protein
MGFKNEVKIELSIHEKRLLEDHIHLFLPDEIIKKLSHALVAGSRFVVPLTSEELDCMLRFIAAEANHCKDEDLEADLDDLYDDLEKYCDD